MSTLTAVGEPSPAASASGRVGMYIRELMARYDLVQADLQQVLGLSQTGVSKRLRGATPFDINELSQVAEYLRIPLADLIAGADAPRPMGPVSASRRPRRGQAVTDVRSRSTRTEP